MSYEHSSGRMGQGIFSSGKDSGLLAEAVGRHRRNCKQGHTPRSWSHIWGDHLGHLGSS